MSNNAAPIVNNTSRGAAVGAAAVAGLVVLTLGTVGTGDPPWKLVGISWVAFGAMAGAIPLGRRAAVDRRGRPLVWGYGLASGAMITSAAVFLLPDAIGHHATYGGFGVASGLLLGYAAHTVGHRLTHAGPFEHTGIELSAHALAAGTVIGVVYGNTPDLGLLLGLAIVSHKGPAGYAAARRLASQGAPTAVLLVPASGVGLTALTASLVDLPANPVLNAVVFGFAAGVFLHVGTDFLPECEVGGEIHAAADLGDQAYHQLDRLRLHAVAATLLGGVAVFVAWLVVAG
jgi:Predicted divalent heavy-metal cations transporter